MWEGGIWNCACIEEDLEKVHSFFLWVVMKIKRESTREPSLQVNDVQKKVVFVEILNDINL